MIQVHNMMSYARAQGAPWEEINKQLSTAQKQYLDAGGDFWEMTHKLGFGNSQILRDRMAAERMMDRANAE